MLSVRKLFFISAVVTATGAFANTTYETNDGVSPPGSFSEKSNEAMKADKNYNVGPINTPVDPSAPEEVEAQEEELDMSTSPDKTTVPQPNPNKIGE